ncbi:hypothetical protein [Siphonobacter sp. SORGH_AS_0500]|uniref:hypothetical protein n=1 Tax=Siphonobacter sp. SORGH_AS_0500 TaxID=1864824 RepID=UPI0028668B65|nr:hypothetical protein [Siphonobacter sp. SORGH_AS_0500]MDR6196150.1 hypothetical protein [Siphonobacter sp. SORGH_AS_0500]
MKNSKVIPYHLLQLREWLQERTILREKNLISVSAIEAEAGMPKYSLHDFITGKKSNIEEYVPKLIEVLFLLGYQVDTEKGS